MAEHLTTPESAAAAATIARAIFTNISRVIKGKPEAVEMLLVVVIAEGHLLLEDVPGVGKTMLARSLASSISCSSNRLQFTPDLLPSDISGVSVFNPATREFDIKPGPIFANIVIADEINRASPRTQSALLEAMAEYQVTIDGATMPLPRPFCVVATQNPVDMEGTFALPEAQRDRFMAEISLGYPDEEAELALVQQREFSDPIRGLTAVATLEQVTGLIALAHGVHTEPAIERYAVAIARATRSHPQIRLGASPRATLQLVAAAKARALMAGRHYVIPDDIKFLAIPVLGHRLIVRSASSGASARQLVAQILDSIQAPQPF